jgi:hypothetical protein
VGVDFPGAFGNGNVALPVELYVEGFVLFVLVWNYGLLVISCEGVTVWIVPSASAVRLVVCEASFVVSTVREDPSTIGDLIIFPVTDKFHSASTVCVGSFSLLFTEKPPTGISVFVCI